MGTNLCSTALSAVIPPAKTHGRRTLVDDLEDQRIVAQRVARVRDGGDQVTNAACGAGSAGIGRRIRAKG